MFIAKLGQEDVVVLTCRKDIGREKESEEGERRGGGRKRERVRESVCVMLAEGKIKGVERRGGVGERGGGRGKERERERERE